MQPSGTNKPKVLLAMSGGVDSSVAAALLLRDGYEVLGCFMRLGSPGETLDKPIPDAVACNTKSLRIGKQGCCSVGDAADARTVAAHLDIPLYVVNFKKDFNRIIDYFEAEYRAGRTPNPCVRCNDWLKFGRLHEHAEQLGCDFVASGHYARVTQDHQGNHELRQGTHADKDQSYVLFGVPRAKLPHMLLPIGHYHTKAEVRTLAHELGLPVFDKPDSQEICFVNGRRYTEFLEERDPTLAQRGDILDTQGNRIGQHDGQHRYTIGQRRGLGVSIGLPIYVVDKDPATNTITVGDETDLFCSGVTAGEANWLTDLPHSETEQPCFARYRSNGELVKATCTTPNGHTRDPSSPTHSGRTGMFDVQFDEPQRAVATGQAIVLYHHEDPTLVLGGGWITHTQHE